ncbi:DegT/DnrJ/EryC1/StrS family aminotransferase [Bowmanella sp. Y26]|uniref:DegT/DnrJ/EryC1/StrS family aminotransferase n=1 Tax=Bowmanella yangjiangensis TaxID=2811230 RepID=UPI001BDCAA1B|nr:DegT/DnrJ/EryC1/StrS family aminotransferase [Bowmanella yangjiangensis]MBT1064845.1 DegT/DnrJ/EryC1/StrS family aminotransferase [Bowmanella yangjiangensis]
MRRKPHPTPTLTSVLPSFTGNVVDEFVQKGGEFSYKARTALYDVFSRIDKSIFGQRVLIPAFHCPTVVQPILKAGFEVEYYRIKKDLQIDFAELADKLNENVAAVVIINFFGFEQPLQALPTLCEANNTLLIEDCSHSVAAISPVRLSGGRGDISIYSFWKMLPSVQGGGWVARVPATLQKTEKKKPVQPLIQSLRLGKQIAEHIFDNMLLGLRRILGHYHYQDEVRVDFDAPVKTSQEVTFYPVDKLHYDFEIPWLSKYMIKNARFNSQVAGILKNYQDLSDDFSKVEAFHLPYADLELNVVPWAVPVILENRNQYDYKLLANDVSFFTFGEELHASLFDGKSASQAAVDDARYLSGSMICFSIHQNLNSIDIHHTKKVVNTLFSQKSSL